MSCLAWVMGARRQIQPPSPSTTPGRGPTWAGQGVNKLWEHLGTTSSHMELWLHLPEWGWECCAAVCAS